MPSDDATPLRARRSGPLSGTIRPPGDKSISHRALMIGTMAVGAFVNALDFDFGGTPGSSVTSGREYRQQRQEERKQSPGIPQSAARPSIEKQLQAPTRGIPVDTTGDGRANAIGFDTNGDGRINALDTTGDGNIDTLLQA